MFDGHGMIHHCPSCPVLVCHPLYLYLYLYLLPHKCLGRGGDVWGWCQILRGRRIPGGVLGRFHRWSCLRRPHQAGAGLTSCFCAIARLIRWVSCCRVGPCQAAQALCRAHVQRQHCWECSESARRKVWVRAWALVLSFHWQLLWCSGWLLTTGRALLLRPGNRVCWVAL